MGNLLRHGVEMYKQNLNLNKKDELAHRVRPVGMDQSKDVYFVKHTAQPESKYRRVAKFLILIGSERAAEILAELDPEQVDEVSKEIALIKIIKPEEKEEIFAEFQEIFLKAANRPYRFAGSARGGVETARRILYAAKGPEKGEEILNKAIPASKEGLFGFLEDFSAEQLEILLKSESVQTIALILSRLSPKVCADTLSKLPADLKPAVLKRMAYQKDVAPDVLEQV